jgi:hypothetical protein
VKFCVGEIAALAVLVTGIGLGMAGFCLVNSITGDHDLMKQKNNQLLEKIVEVQGVCWNVLKGQ